MRTLVVLLFFCGLLLGYKQALIPAWLIVLYSSLSIFTFVVFAIDKRAAIKDKWRVEEFSLYFFSVLGGWPGALLAQQLLHHKNKKRSFRAFLVTCIMINLAFYGDLINNVLAL